MLPRMDDFLAGRISLDTLLLSASVNPHEVPADLAAEMARRDLSHAFVYSWCQAAQLFGRSQRLTSLLCALLERDDHEAHEEIADALQDLRAPSTVACLFARTNRPLAYLEYDDGAALARRCVWALHDIGTPEAIGKLRLLSSDSREEVSGEATARLAALRHPGAPKAYRLARDANLGSQ